MPNDTVTVHLKIRTDSHDGFTSTTASDGSTYYYKYDGGPDDDGSVSFKTGDGSHAVDVSLHDSGTNYEITSVRLTDPNSQLSCTVSSDKRTATITDADTADETGSYCVTVQDTSKASCTFDCDPTITNKPN
jgi:hypothetical protein